MKKLVFLCTILLGQMLFSQENNIFLKRDFWKTNPSIKTINKKIAEGNNIAALNSNAFDGTIYAILENVDNKTIKYLLSKPGNEVNKKTHDGRTYIFWAGYNGNVDIMKYVYNKGAKTDIIDTNGNTFLNFAATTGQLNKEVYNYAFKIGAAISKEKNHDGANALLLIAPYVKDFELIDLFISNGASLNDKDSNGNGLFEYAAKSGNISFLKTLLAKNVSIGKNAMVFASQGLRRQKNTLATYKALEKLGAAVNVVNHRGRNPLHAIAYNSKDLETYTYFIKKGVSADLQDKGGDSPFMNAANSNTLEVVQFLLKYIKDINVKDENGRSALAMAVNKNTLNVVEFLLANNANINTVDKKGNTLSYYLINNFKSKNTTAFEAKLKLLEKNGLVVNKPQNAGNTLLHIAVERNNLALLKRLASFKIDVNAKNKQGLTALQIAAMKANDTAIINYLLSIGADKNVKTDFDETVYDLASENELLQKQNINISFLK
ncbi:ankyrin repeat domain-containing protein [uncultured Polaribacter sp.]|uniref:ankyrin repeat domain-containing protein n=1 Tax=uncultured Polaribacter sp. TaxID=174711 RepID=UPI002632E6B0|nr:ankyrin repeat domain-containing protein [uncultured Polaribacter sp.]